MNYVVCKSAMSCLDSWADYNSNKIHDSETNQKFEKFSTQIRTNRKKLNQK